MSSKYDFGKRIKAAGLDELTRTSGADTGNANLKKMVAISDLHPFKLHPFKVVDNEDMKKLIESIKESGIITPLIVRKDSASDGYEIIAGHRRKHAAEAAGLTEVPVYVEDLDNNAAVIAMVDSNLQRSSFLPSERAFSYRMKMEALKRQGKRTDLDEEECDKPHMEAAEKVAEDANDSATQVRRYIRLTYLTKELLDMVDAGTIKLTPAVELSYLTLKNQRTLYDYMQRFNVTSVSNAQAAELRKNGAQDPLDEAAIDLLFTTDAPKPKKYKVAFDDVEFKTYFKPDTSAKKMRETIILALEEWNRNHPEE